ncbi:MAG: ribonuclease P protein component [Actinomycetota bacterium]|nr:ribonuclease P protein component [Actinomycetota bacterium]
MRSPVSLRTHADFRRVYAAGRRARRDGILLVVLERPEGAGPRLGLSVPARVGTAVERNRVRRRMRAIFGATVGDRPVDVVAAVDRSALSATFQELGEHFQSVFGRALGSRG